MNKTTVILVLSLAANTALAVLVYSRRTPANAVPADQAGPTPAALTAGANPAPAPATAGAAGAPGAKMPPNPDDVAYVARLRAAGMPADLIRELVSARVQARYRDRRRALLPDDTYQYWRSWNQTGWAAASPETRARVRDLDKEVNGEIRALLGAGPDALGDYERRLYDQMAGYLSYEKIQQIEAIRKDYDELATNVRSRGRGLVLKADREQLRLLERERRKDLEAVLTPGELLEYDLRASPTASALRNRLNYFEPTEQEFRTLAQLQLELDRQFGTSNLSGEEQDRRRAAEKDLVARLQSVLPPERYADYLVSIDGMFSETRYFTNSYDLNPSVAKEIVALKQSTWRRIDELQQTGVTGDQRTAALQALEREVENRLTARLGADVFAKYKKTGPTWLNRLRPTPPPRP